MAGVGWLLNEGHAGPFSIIPQVAAYEQKVTSWPKFIPTETKPASFSSTSYGRRKTLPPNQRRRTAPLVPTRRLVRGCRIQEQYLEAPCRRRTTVRRLSQTARCSTVPASRR